MRLRVLGPVELRGPAGETLRLGGRRQETLLALLCAEINRVIPARRLAELLWAQDEPKDPLTAIQVQVHRLRRTLTVAGLHLDYRAPGYVLRADQSDLDTLAFEALLAATPVDTAAAATLNELLSSALTLWRGEPYLGLHEVPALRREAARLNETRMSWLERVSETLLRQGETATALAHLRLVADEAPLRERSAGLLMEALAADGRVNDAVAHFHTYRLRQAEETGLDPGPLVQAVYQRLLDPGTAPASPAADPATGCTPVPEPLTPMVGREGEIDHLIQLIGRGHRLVTLTGPGGVGKTRLAIELANRKWPGEAAFVELAAVAEAEDVPDAFARALGVRLPTADAVADLAAALGRRPLPVVVDNFEQVLTAGGFLAGLLSRCPGLVAVVTSREPLAVAGETAYRVRPLPVPAPDAGPEEILATAAVALFLERTAGEPGADRVAAAHVGELCRQLGGLPLAIELAAALARYQSMQEVMRSMADPAIGEPVMAAIRWSYERLAQAEQLMFGRLCVFRGHFDASAAREVSAGDPAAFDRMAALGLLQPHRESAGLRYSIAPIFGAFVPPPPDAVLAAHFDYHARHCRDPRFLDDELLIRIDSGYPDFLAALKWGLAQPAVDAFDLGIAMVMYWLWREQTQIALRWLDRISARFAGAPQRLARADVLRAAFLRNVGRLDEAAELAAAATATLSENADAEWLLSGYGVGAAIADSRGDTDELVACSESAVATARASLPRRLAEALGYLAYAYAAAEECAGAAQTAREALALLEGVDSLALRAASRANAAQALIETGHAVMAVEVLVSGLDEMRQTPDGMPGYWLPLGWGHLATGDHAAAARWFRTVVQELVHTGQWPPVAEAIAGWACAMVGAGHVREAAVALGGAERLLQRFEIRVSPWIRRRLDAAYATIAERPNGIEQMAAGAQLTADAVARLVSP